MHAVTDALSDVFFFQWEANQSQEQKDMPHIRMYLQP